MIYKCKLAKNDCGFSLIEILVAMLILLLIVFAFTPLMVGSIQRITYAGDKTEALYSSQSEVEVKIAERDTIDGKELVFQFGDEGDINTTITVPGGLVNVDTEVNDAKAWLSGFVPNIPYISIDPNYIIEGYEDIPGLSINVSGTFTDFTNDTLSARIIGEGISSGLEFAANEDVEGVINNFNSVNGLVNSDGPYTIELSWILSSGVTVKASALLYVFMPEAVAVGGGQSIVVSPGEHNVWSVKQDAVSGAGTIKDIIWTGVQYIAVTENSRILNWSNREEPTLSDNHYSNLNSIAYGNGKYVAVGNSGKIVTSTSITKLSNGQADIGQIVNEITNNLNAVAHGGNNYVAVGNNGTILVSSNGLEWTDKSLINEEEVITLNGIVYGNSEWLAVGGIANGAAFYRSTNLNGGNWEKISINSDCNILNDVIFDGNYYIAVGDNGCIIVLDTAYNIINNFSEIPNIDYTSIDWRVTFSDNDDLNEDTFTEHIVCVVVGTEGRIVTNSIDKNNEGVWSRSDSDAWDVVRNSGSNLHGIALRWTP